MNKTLKAPTLDGWAALVGELEANATKEPEPWIRLAKEVSTNEEDLARPAPLFSLGPASSKGEVALRFSEPMLRPLDHRAVDYGLIFELSVTASSDGSVMVGEYSGNQTQRLQLEVKRML